MEQVWNDFYLPDFSVSRIFLFPTLMIGFIKRDYILRGHFYWETTGEIKGYQVD